MLKSRLLIGLVLPLLLLSVFSSTTSAQSQDRVTTIVLSTGAGRQLLPIRASAAAASSGTQVWVDTVHKTSIWAATAIFSTCEFIGTGSFTVLSKPMHGQLFFGQQDIKIPTGPCAGMTVPYVISWYTWTGKQKVLQDPFTLQWTSPKGVPVVKLDMTFISELAKILQEAEGTVAAPRYTSAQQQTQQTSIDLVDVRRAQSDAAQPSGTDSPESTAQR